LSHADCGDTGETKTDIAVYPTKSECNQRRGKASKECGASMSETLPVVYLARHGETAWTITGQHTGLTDLPLTKRGEANAQRLGERLAGIHFAKVLTSPLQRAMRTCELAGFAQAAEPDHDLVEWNYGSYEGRLTVDILRERPDWQLFRDGCPDGESPQQVAERADRVVARIRQVAGNVLLFSSGHFLRVLAARWIGIAPINGQGLMLSTASLSSFSYENSLSRPAISLWNDAQHALKSNEPEHSENVETRVFNEGKVNR
jgi:broad specificity phosphatase PhoE